MLIAVEIEKLGQLYEVVAILAAVYSDHKTACRRGEVVILVQREAVEAEGIFEDASVHHADRFDQPPRAAWILCPTRDAARIGVQLFALMDMLPGRGSSVPFVSHLLHRPSLLVAALSLTRRGPPDLT